MCQIFKFHVIFLPLFMFFELFFFFLHFLRILGSLFSFFFHFCYIIVCMWFSCAIFFHFKKYKTSRNMLSFCNFFFRIFKIFSSFFCFSCQIFFTLWDFFFRTVCLSIFILSFSQSGLDFQQFLQFVKNFSLRWKDFDFPILFLPFLLCVFIIHSMFMFFQVVLFSIIFAFHQMFFGVGIVLQFTLRATVLVNFVNKPYTLFWLISSSYCQYPVTEGFRQCSKIFSLYNFIHHLSHCVFTL